MLLERFSKIVSKILAGGKVEKDISVERESF